MRHIVMIPKVLKTSLAPFFLCPCIHDLRQTIENEVLGCHQEDEDLRGIFPERVTVAPNRYQSSTLTTEELGKSNHS